jgi:uncharacterized protein (TIGR02118 family)
MLKEETTRRKEETMYKVIWLVKFRKDMEREEVLQWWRGRHGDLAGATPGMIRYVQNHWVSPLDQATQLPVAGGEPAFDGHAEHWFESREAYEAAMQSDEWKETQLDGPVGFDSSTLVGGLLEEYVVNWDPRLDGRKYGTPT